jgi:ribose/xylose/arabinose/galactoside ABC-type transport system permease subunit
MLTAIAAVLIGGVSLTGGAGGLLGALLGTLFLAVIQNGLLLSSVPVFWQGTVSGLILVGAVAIGVVRDRVRLRGHRLRGARA